MLREDLVGALAQPRRDRAGEQFDLVEEGLASEQERGQALVGLGGRRQGASEALQLLGQPQAAQAQGLLGLGLAARTGDRRTQIARAVSPGRFSGSSCRPSASSTLRARAFAARPSSSSLRRRKNGA
jgi:hypothetical protein